MALHYAYMDEEEIPDWIDMEAIGLEGGLEGESGNPGYSSAVTGIYSVSGAIGDVAWIDENDTTPACLFHGDADNTVTINSDMFILFGLVEVTEIDGSNPIDARMDEVGIEHCYEINEGLGHVPYMGNPAVYDTTISILSNFLASYVCGVDLDCSYHEIAETIEEINPGDFSIYPNPASREFRIAGPELSQFRTCEITDTSGKLVKTVQLNNTGTVGTGNLRAGVYYVVLRNETQTVSLKLIVE
jgi:hypothetical protein